MKDLYNNLKVVSVVDPVVAINTVVITPVEVDLAGWNSALIIYATGLSGDVLSGSVYHTLTLEHADDDGTGVAGAYTSVATADMLGVTPASGVIYTVDAAAEDNTVYTCGYVGGKRFLKFTPLEVGTTTVGMPIAVTVVKGHGRDAPNL